MLKIHPWLRANAKEESVDVAEPLEFEKRYLSMDIVGISARRLLVEFRR